MVPRVGEQTGLAQALANTTPLLASAVMFGMDTCPFVPAMSGNSAVASAPRSSAMINRMFGLAAVAPTPPAPAAPPAPPEEAPAAPPAAGAPPAPPLPAGRTNVIVAVALSIAARRTPSVSP